jgi:hypothetical protein
MGSPVRDVVVRMHSTHPSSMKILFLTPTLQEGGGVADYTVMLAGALRGRGDHVRCVSLSERPGEGGDHDRLDASLAWKSRRDRLQGILDEFRPDIVSLQYVPYGFHPKGLALRLPGVLASLRGAFRWHLMFHELWIGEEDHYTLLQRMVGGIQRRVVSALGKLAPAVIHTSNPEYCHRLQGIGMKAVELPLFGNIPVSANASGSRESLILRAVPAVQSHETLWIMVFFGGLLPGWDPGELLGYLRAARILANIDRCLIVRLGKSGRNGDRLWQGLQEGATSDFSFTTLGEASPAIISSHLHAADFGIVTTPLHLLGKSGSAAAMREHGLPLIMTRGAQSMNGKIPYDVILPGHHSADRLSGIRKSPPRERLTEVAERFRADLQAVVK